MPGKLVTVKRGKYFPRLYTITANFFMNKNVTHLVNDADIEYSDV